MRSSCILLARAYQEGFPLYKEKVVECFPLLVFEGGRVRSSIVLMSFLWPEEKKKKEEDLIKIQ